MFNMKINLPALFLVPYVDWGYPGVRCLIDHAYDQSRSHPDAHMCKKWSSLNKTWKPDDPPDHLEEDPAPSLHVAAMQKLVMHGNDSTIT